MGQEVLSQDPTDSGGTTPEDEASTAVGKRSIQASDLGDSSPESLAGCSLGRYRLLFPIAAGGMAQVWAAKPETGALARSVVIKLVRREYADDDEYARMFVDEALIASSIHHPNVCEIQEFGHDKGVLFMVLEWVAGESLSGLLQRGKEITPLPPELGARIIAEACAGLHAAHEAVDDSGQLLGVVHRDVSPPNILVSTHGQVKVSDFGIAKARNQLHARTKSGEIKGKFAYIAPEQILGRGVDRRGDIYALGCVLYMSTLGVRPFGSGAEALGKIVRGKYHEPRSIAPAYPEGLQAVIVKALALDPDERYQTAEEMRYALEAWLRTVKPVTHADIAQMVNERLSPERRQLVDTMRTAGKKLSEALAGYFMAQSEKTETPTATSGLVVQPALLAGAASVTPARGQVPHAHPGVGEDAIVTARPEAPFEPMQVPGALGSASQPKQWVALGVAAGALAFAVIAYLALH